MNTDTPFLIFSTPRSRSTLLMRILDSTPGVRCGGEKRDLLWSLKKLHAQRDELYAQTPAAFDTIEAQLSAGHFPSHLNHSTSASWGWAMRDLLRGWINPPVDASAWGMKDVHVAKNGHTFGFELWSWLQNTIPDLKIIFIMRPPSEVLSSMQKQGNWWIPSYRKCWTECAAGIALQQEAFESYHVLNPSSTVLLQSADILDHHALSEALSPLGIPVDPIAHATQLAIKL